MLNKIVGASLIAVICSPIFANDNELALTPESVEKCINVYDKIYYVQEDLLKRDLRVSSTYSHFRVAQENYNKAIRKRDEYETKLSSLLPSDPEFLVYTTLWNDTTEIVQTWDEQRIAKMDIMQNVLYGRQLRADRLKKLRTTSLRCKGRKFDKQEVSRICSTKLDSLWCEGRF